MHQTTEKIAPSGRAALTRTTRTDMHREYRSISEMMYALKLNQWLKYREPITPFLSDQKNVTLSLNFVG
jgi:hypothetical protein